MSALHPGETGDYSALAKRPLPEGLTLVFVPSLAALLMHAKQLNDGALSERQVLAVRDASKVVVVHEDVARAMEEQRGYADIDAADAWQSWLRLCESA